MLVDGIWATNSKMVSFILGSELHHQRKMAAPACGIFWLQLEEAETSHPSSNTLYDCQTQQVCVTIQIKKSCKILCSKTYFNFPPKN